MMDDLTVVIPCRNENVENVTQTYTELTNMGCHVVIVDDGNTMLWPDDVNVVTYPAPMGYGYALKTGIRSAKTPIVLTMDGDGQHTVSDAQKLYKVFKLANSEMVVGQRWLKYEKWYRKIGRKFLNFIASVIVGHYLVDLNSGMRIFDAKLACNYFPILCDTFSFTTSLSISMVADGHKVVYFPIDVKPRFSGKSHVNVIKDGFITLWFILYCGIGCRTRKLRAWFAGR